MIDRESRHASIRYVINRLSYSLAKGTLVVTPEIKFLLLPTELDSSMQTPLLSEKPESLVSIPVNFRRRSNSDDIEVVLSFTIPVLNFACDRSNCNFLITL